MEINRLSFITGIERLSMGKIILDKEYSREFKLVDNSIISLSSTVGLVRNMQQDCMAVSKNGNYLMLLVADGMGGMYDGERASYLTAKIIKDFFENEEEQYLRIMDDILLNEVMKILINEITLRIGDYSGTTLSLAIILDDITYLVNIGDSRIYTLKNGIMNLETSDDSLGFERYNPKNMIDRDKLRFYRYNNIITNSIIKGTDVKINICEIDNRNYDMLCLTTDGINDILREEEIEMMVSTGKRAYEITELSKSREIDRVSIEDTDIYKNSDFGSIVKPGMDNASAIIYRKKIKR